MSESSAYAIARFLISALVLLYIVSPVDLMPGLPFDDLAVLAAAIVGTKKMGAGTEG